MRAFWWLVAFAVAMPDTFAAENTPVSNFLEHVVLDARKLPGKWVRTKLGDYETPQGSSNGFATLRVARLPLPWGMPITVFLRQQSDFYEKGQFAVRPCEAVSPSAKIESHCLFADGHPLTLRVLNCTYQAADVPYFFSVEYQESLVGGDESAFFRRARQVERAAIGQFRELSQ